MADLKDIASSQGSDISNVVKIVYDGLNNNYKRLKCSGIDSKSKSYEFNKWGKSYHSIRAVSSLVYTLTKRKYDIYIDKATAVLLNQYHDELRHLKDLMSI